MFCKKMQRKNREDEKEWKKETGRRGGERVGKILEKVGEYPKRGEEMLLAHQISWMKILRILTASKDESKWSNTLSFKRMKAKIGGIFLPFVNGKKAHTLLQKK